MQGLDEGAGGCGQATPPPRCHHPNSWPQHSGPSLTPPPSSPVPHTQVGWPPRPSAKVRIALANSFMVGTLTLEAPDPGSPAAPPPRLVGLARATSDGVFNATLWDVAVDPDLQNLGLGKALVETMVRALLRLDITNVTLFADAHTISFYSALGFQPDPQGIKGMFWFVQGREVDGGGAEEGWGRCTPEQTCCGPGLDQKG